MASLTLRQQMLRTLVVWATLLACMMLFGPDKVPVVALILPFVGVYIALYNLWKLASMVRARYLVANGEWEPRRKLGMALCVSVVLLLVLQSLGQLTVRDIGTVVAIVVLGYLYLTRSRFTVSKQ